MRRLRPLPLTAAAFQPYGDVISAATAAESIPINYGLTTRYHDLAQINTEAGGGRAGVSIFRSQPMSPAVILKIMERHPIASQAFMPLTARPYLVAVAPEGPLVEEAITLFLASSNQGVNYHPGVWHHFSLALGETADFLVIDSIRPKGEDSAVNLEEVTLKQPIEVVV